MPRLEILVIDHYGHTGTPQPVGPIIQRYMVHPEEAPGERYADYCALYGTWRTWNGRSIPPEMVGFFGYRKYLAPIPLDHTEDWLKPAHAPNWWQCSKEDFDEYRTALAEDRDTYGGACISNEIKRLLAQYDILQAAPFPLTDGDIIQDFIHSRSRHDAGELMRVGIESKLYLKPLYKIHQYHFITRWSVFDRMMREMEIIRKELDLHITAEDATDAAYKQRPMAYIMERVYSFWLANSGLSVKEVPVLHCWDM